MNFQFKKNQGFMLVEMIISVGIFSLVMTIGIGSLLSIIEANKKAQSFKIVINNLNLAMESVSKDLRVGSAYNCGSFAGGDCAGGGSSIYFKSRGGKNIIIRLNNGLIERSINGGSFVGITSPDIVVEDLKFYVSGSSVGDGIQSKVLISVRGRTNSARVSDVKMDLQTTVSQRSLIN